MKTFLTLSIAFSLLLNVFAQSDSSGLPVTWDQNTGYDAGKLVISNGSTYLALQTVPNGTPLTSTSFWVSLDSQVPETTTVPELPKDANGNVVTPDVTQVASLTTPTNNTDTNDTNDTSQPVVTAKLSNLSTRGYVGTGDSVMIAGFIVSGTGTTTVTIRALGPTIAAAPYNVAGTITDPVLTIVDGAGQVVASNDNWGDFTASSDIQAGGRAPSGPSEAVVQISVTQGNYTAIVTGAGGATGVSLVEVYDEGTGGDSIELSNLSTRGYVGTGDSVMIAGFIVGGDTGSSSTVTVRALGPTIAAAPYNVAGTITDPVLTLVDGSGQVFATVDNWESSTSASAVTASSRNPVNAVESAHQFSVSPGNYTAIVTGAGGNTGVSLVEVYKE
jgi:hypothetical protein